jgi:hypothetical protein
MLTENDIILIEFNIKQSVNNITLPSLNVNAKNSNDHHQKRFIAFSNLIF